MKIFVYNKIKILILSLFVCSVILSQEKILERKPLTFDFGSNASAKYLNSIVVDEKVTYDSNTGYGWYRLPNYSFERNGLRGTTLRNDHTIDGVTGKEIEFKVNIPSGKWWFTFWMEAGNDYTNSATLKIDGDEKKIDWFRIKAGEEGESQQTNLYRVYHTLSDVAERGFTFNLQGVKDSIRILGFSLIPFSVPSTNLHFKIERMVNVAGKYKSKVSIGDLQKYLMEQVQLYYNDSYIYYLFQQTSLFMEADRLLSMMGWGFLTDCIKLFVCLMHSLNMTMKE